jgi:hypothetical protein
MNFLKLTKPERKFLATPVLFGWNATQNYNGYWHWDDDPMFPVKIGSVAESLVAKGCAEFLPNSYRPKAYFRASLKGKEFKCRNRSCDKGNLFTLNENDNGATCTGEKCKHCDGIGIVAVLVVE